MAQTPPKVANGYYREEDLRVQVPPAKALLVQNNYPCVHNPSSPQKPLRLPMQIIFPGSILYIGHSLNHLL